MERAKDLTEHGKVDLIALIKMFWAGKWLILICTSLFSGLGIYYALGLPNVYKAEAYVMSAESSLSSGGAALGQLGGLAGLAGLSLPNSTGEKFKEAQQVLQSRKFIMSFIERHNLLIPVMASTSYDFSTNSLSYDETMYDTQNDKWVREVKSPVPLIPTYWEAYKEFIKILEVTQDRKTGLLKISIEFYDPYQAKDWVNLLIEDLNQYMVDNDKGKYTKGIEFLNHKIKDLKVASVKSVFFRLLEEQYQNLMLANINQEYVFKVVDPAIVPERKSKPKRALICIFFALTGAIIGALAVAIRNYRMSIK